MPHSSLFARRRASGGSSEISSRVPTRPASVPRQTTKERVISTGGREIDPAQPHTGVVGHLRNSSAQRSREQLRAQTDAEDRSLGSTGRLEQSYFLCDPWEAVIGRRIRTPHRNNAVDTVEITRQRLAGGEANGPAPEAMTNECVADGGGRAGIGMLDNKNGHPEKVRGLTLGLNYEPSNQSPIG